MTTIHANGPRDALTRLEAMVGMAGLQLSESATRQMMSRAINVIVQLSRGTDGHRRLVAVCEITGMEGEVISTQEIFSFRQTGIDRTGRVLGHFRASGVRPKFAERLRSYGVAIHDEMFDPDRVFE